MPTFQNSFFNLLVFAQLSLPCLGRSEPGMPTLHKGRHPAYVWWCLLVSDSPVWGHLSTTMHDHTPVPPPPPKENRVIRPWGICMMYELKKLYKLYTVCSKAFPLLSLYQKEETYDFSVTVFQFSWLSFQIPKSAKILHS